MQVINDPKMFKDLYKSIPNSSLYFICKIWFFKSMLFKSWVFTSLKIIDELEWSFIYYVKMGPYSSLILFLPSLLEFLLEFKSMPVYGRVSWPTKYNIISIVLLYQNFSKIVTPLKNFGPIFKLDVILSLYYYSPWF